jgi:hypothetical protein
MERRHLSSSILDFLSYIQRGVGFGVDN